MLKKYENIIKRVLNPNREDMSKVGFDRGFYYAFDGYRIAQFEEKPNDLPVYGENEHQPNYKKYAEDAANVNYTELVIPYTVKQIKEWDKENKKIDKNLRLPFKLGVKAHFKNGRSFRLGINHKFLTDAMETTGSNKLWIPKYGCCMLMKGNGFVWLIMGIQLSPEDDTMTEIKETNV
jgi:hypothetical protein